MVSGREASAAQTWIQYGEVPVFPCLPPARGMAPGANSPEERRPPTATVPTPFGGKWENCSSNGEFLLRGASRPAEGTAQSWKLSSMWHFEKQNLIFYTILQPEPLYYPSPLLWGTQVSQRIDQ